LILYQIIEFQWFEEKQSKLLNNPGLNIFIGWIREMIRKMIRKILLLYITYVLIGSVLIFAIPRNVSPEYAKKSNYENYYSDEVGTDRAIILDNPLES